MASARLIGIVEGKLSPITHMADQAGRRCEEIQERMLHELELGEEGSPEENHDALIGYL